MMIGLTMVLVLTAQDSTPNQRLAAVGERVYFHQIEENGLARLRAGLPVERLHDVSEAGSRKDVEFWREVLQQLGKLPDRDLTYDERISKAILAWQAERAVEAGRFYWFSSGITPYASPMAYVHQMFRALPLGTGLARDRYLRLVEQYAGLVDGYRTKLEGQVQRRLVLPRPEVEVVIPLWRAYRQEPRKSALWVNEGRLQGASPAERDVFSRALERTITEKIDPSLDRMVAYLEGEYRTHAPTEVGLSQYPDGTEYYRHLVKLHTTLDVTPEEIFRTGQQEIDSLTKELDRVRQAVGFQGTLAAFKTSLRTDPRYFVKTPDEVGRLLEKYAAAMEPKLDSLFVRRPRAPYGVARLAPELEPTMTYGYYNEAQPSRPKGIYFYNGSNLSERNLAMAEGLTYHELAPGHHFQIMLQRENQALPRFRQEMHFTAYSEGWGDYASMLGADAGLYQDPYSKAGRLMMEMMLGTRLVLDVGMNFYGWSLERARKFMAEHTLETPTQIASETLRYGVDIPGQALAYRMGSLTIRQLRERSREALGGRFDIRRFHDAVLSIGSVPLAVLERHVLGDGRAGAGR